MGARPIFALNVVNFPRDTLPLDYLERDPAGRRAHKAPRPALPILGGHSVDDPEPKYGLVVLGTGPSRTRMVANAGAASGRRAGADQAARHRHHHHRHQARPGRRPRLVDAALRQS